MFKLNRCIILKEIVSKTIKLTVIRMNATDPTLFVDTASPPCRFVLMTASALDVKLNLHHIDLFKAENTTEFYKKVNYLQKVPAMSFGDEVLIDSHAIALYLCQKHELKSENIYPMDIMKRGLIHQMMYFNCSTLFPLDSAMFTDFFAGKQPINEQRVSQLTAAMDYLEYRVTQNEWLAGDQMTLCDLCCAATVSSLQLLLPPDERHVRLENWMQRLNEQPCFEANRHGLKRLSDYVEKMKVYKCF